MKIFRIKGHYYTGYVCAESWIQAIDVFKNNYIPSQAEAEEYMEWAADLGR